VPPRIGGKVSRCAMRDRWVRGGDECACLVVLAMITYFHEIQQPMTTTE